MIFECKSISRGKVNKWFFIAETILLPQKFSSPELTNQVFKIQFCTKNDWQLFSSSAEFITWFMVPRNTHMCKSTLEDTQQLRKLIAGPTWEEKIEKKLKCWVNSTEVSHGGCPGPESCPERCCSHCNKWKDTVCLLLEVLGRGLVKLVFPSHVRFSQTDWGLFTQHKRESARPSLNAGGSSSHS